MTGLKSMLSTVFIAVFILLLIAYVVIYARYDPMRQTARWVKYSGFAWILAAIAGAIALALHGIDTPTVAIMLLFFVLFMAVFLTLQLFMLSVSERGLSMTLRLAARKLKELFGR